MSILQSYLPDLRIITEEECQENRVQHVGATLGLDSSELLRNTLGFEDTRYSYIPLEGYKSEKDESLRHPIHGYTPYQHYVNKTIPDAPRILILGDSYINSFLSDIFAESFSEMIVIPFYCDADYVIEEIENLQPDIVLFESVERVFGTDSLEDLIISCRANAFRATEKQFTGNPAYSNEPV